MKFILASKSPRRKEILERINLDFKVINSNIDESIVSIHMDPYKYSIKLAELKAEKISIENSNYTVIGADTIVSINNQIFRATLILSNTSI